MARTWFVRLAPIVFAILNLGMPRSAAAAEVRPCSESTRMQPRFELVSKAANVQSESRPGVVRLNTATSCAPATLAQIGLPTGVIQLNATDPAHCISASSAVQLPHSRAPPAQS